MLELCHYVSFQKHIGTARSKIFKKKHFVVANPWWAKPEHCLNIMDQGIFLPISGSGGQTHGNLGGQGARYFRVILRYNHVNSNS